jgi:hypothetical protein
MMRCSTLRPKRVLPPLPLILVGIVGVCWLLSDKNMSFAEDPPKTNIEAVPKELLGYIDNPEINESSGLARSNLHDHVLWTHNDSGDKARLFAINDHGKCQCEIRLRGIHPIDWEDITSFQIDNTSYLAVADTGNNQLTKRTCRVHILREPQLTDKEVELFAEIPFVFEDGPHDCESLAYDPMARQFLLASKNLKFRTGIYSIPWPETANTVQPKGARTARLLGHIPIPFVTSMDMAPDGRRLTFLSFFHAAEYTLPINAGWKQSFLTTPTMTTLPGRSQGESICYSTDGSCYFLTSERLPTPLLKVPLKGAGR